jgi:hypothetical protein
MAVTPSMLCKHSFRIDGLEDVDKISLIDVYVRLILAGIQ